MSRRQLPLIPVKGGWVAARPRYLFTRRRRPSFPAFVLLVLLSAVAVIALLRLAVLLVAGR